MAMATFKRIDHVVIATEELADAAAKWERNLGLKVDATLERDELKERLKAADKAYRLREKAKDMGMTDAELDELEGR